MGNKLRVGWPIWVGVVSQDLERQRRFYREVLGFKELGAAESWVSFDMGWPNFFELKARSDDPQYDRPRYQVAFGVDDIEASRRELIARGVDSVSEIVGKREIGGYWCYFKDPEGNVLAISQRVGTAPKEPSSA
ncbi:MAG: VOC family protein [Candidatus Dormibacteraeota bacterium]|nr:VOC family protein [Candidatus Dormibacteraeota bacterium]